MLYENFNIIQVFHSSSSSLSDLNSIVLHIEIIQKSVVGERRTNNLEVNNIFQSSVTPSQLLLPI